MLDRGQEEARQGSQPGQGGAKSRPRTLLSDGESADEGRTEQQQNREQLAAGAGKEQRLRARREKPNMEPSRTVHPSEGNRASPMAGTRSCTTLPQGTREGIPRTTRDQFNLHLEERAQEGKNAISLKGVAREAMKAASAGALCLLGATWKVRKTASSWNQAQGALTRVTQISRRRESCQTGESPGQRERGAAPGSHHRDEPEGQDGSCNLEEQRGELAREGSRTPQLEHSLQHREVAREKPRPEPAGTARPREGNRKPSGPRIRRCTSLPQGAWSRLQREAGNHFNVLNATNTARRHTVGTQIPEKGSPGIGPAPRRQEAQRSERA